MSWVFSLSDTLTPGSYTAQFLMCFIRHIVSLSVEAHIAFPSVETGKPRHRDSPKDTQQICGRCRNRAQAFWALYSTLPHFSSTLDSERRVPAYHLPGVFLPIGLLGNCLVLLNQNISYQWINQRGTHCTHFLKRKLRHREVHWLAKSDAEKDPQNSEYQHGQTPYHFLWGQYDAGPTGRL